MDAALTSLSLISSESLQWECVSVRSIEEQSQTELSLQQTDSLQCLGRPANSRLDQPHINHLRPRTQQQIRNTYFQKLKKDGLLSDKPRAKCHHMVIFDWDDTFLCTAHITALKIEKLEQLMGLERSKMQEIDVRTEKALLIALELANVYIVTNSIMGWVEYSAKTYMPKTMQVISNHKIQIISARSRYSDIFPGDPLLWKIQTFKDIVLSLNKRQVVLNLLCVGDSKFQIQAADRAGQMFDRKFIKTIKFREKPRMDQLSKQLNLLCSKLAEVIRVPKSLTIKMEQKK